MSMLGDNYRAASGASSRGRHRSRNQQRGLQLFGGQPTLERIVHHDNLMRVWNELKQFGGQAPGIDGIRFKKLSTTEAGKVLRQLEKSILDHSYRPRATRSVLIPKPSGGSRELRLATVFDRTVAKALSQALAEIVAAELLPTVFGSRPQHSVMQLLATVEQSMLQKDLFVLATDDIRRAFDSVPITDALAAWDRVVHDDGLRWLIETVTRGHEGDARTVGIDQGCPLSPATLNLLLNFALDRPFVADPGNPLLLRWVDNLTIVCNSVSEGHQAFQRVTELLTPAGFHLKGDEGPPTNFRRQGAKRQVLGYLVSMENGRLKLGIPKTAWTGLQESLEEAYLGWNPAETARAVVRGWLEAYGVAYGSVGQEALIYQVSEVAAGLGFRELGPRDDLGACIRRSEERWDRLRCSSNQGEPGG